MIDKMSDEELEAAVKKLKSNKLPFDCLNEILKRMLDASHRQMEAVDDIRTLGRLQGKISFIRDIALIINDSNN